MRQVGAREQRDERDRRNQKAEQKPRPERAPTAGRQRSDHERGDKKNYQQDQVCGRIPDHRSAFLSWREQPGSCSGSDPSRETLLRISPDTQLVETGGRSRLTRTTCRWLGLNTTPSAGAPVSAQSRSLHCSRMLKLSYVARSGAGAHEQQRYEQGLRAWRQRVLPGPVDFAPGLRCRTRLLPSRPSNEVPVPRRASGWRHVCPVLVGAE